MGNTTSTEAASFGALLTAFRHRRHFTQAHLAERLGVHRHAIGRWEQGDFLPKQKGLVLELAKHLHLDDQEARQFLEASLTALAPYWSVPLRRNPLFTGREEILAALHTQLGIDQAGTRIPSAALQGLGGVGKTQIALEYAYRYALEYSAVCWIAAETVESILSSLLQMAEVLHVPEQHAAEQQRIVAAVQHWFATHSQWLLIWDNLEDLDLLERLLPSTRQGVILLTTRCQTLGTLAQGIDLLPMVPEEGLLFLVRRAKVLDSTATSEDVRQLAVQRPTQYQAAAELVTDMGGLPLALDQAGAYLEATQCGLSTYLELFRTQRAALLQQRGEGVRAHPASVWATFTLALEATAGRHPAVGELLHVCALLQPETIPEELFRQGAAQWGSPLAVVCRDLLEWNRVVAVACAYSLLSRHPETQTLSLHRLVQAVLEETMTEAERTEWSRRAIGALDALFPDVRFMTEPASWQQGARLLPHALRCLQRVGDAEASLVLASLAYKVAQYLSARARSAEAEPLYQRAMQIREQTLGPDHLDVASSLNELAGLYLDQGQYVRAEPLFQRALQIREQTLGPDHALVARALNNLALLSWLQGRYTEAEPLYQRAMQIEEQTPSADPTMRTLLCSNLAHLYQDQGRYAEAEALYQRALALWGQHLGSDHPSMMRTLNGLAGLCCKQGRYTEAEQLYQRALAIWEQLFGPDHPDVAHLLNGLAGLHREQGRDAEAEALYQRALCIREQAWGAAHPDVAETLHDLALFRQQQGHLSEARTLDERALQIRSQFLGEAHPKTIATRALYAQLVQATWSLEAERASELRAEGISGPRKGEKQTDGSAGRGAPTRSPDDQQAWAKPLSGNAHLSLSNPSEETKTASRQQADGRTRPETPDRLPGPAMRVAVRGATDQVAYTRTVKMRTVTFTCTICGHTVTQRHYPCGQLKYCSEACKAVGAAQRQEKRVAKQRKKRRIAREAHLRAQPPGRL